MYLEDTQNFDVNIFTSEAGFFIFHNYNKKSYLLGEKCQKLGIQLLTFSLPFEQISFLPILDTTRNIWLWTDIIIACYFHTWTILIFSVWKYRKNTYINDSSVNHVQR